MMLCLPPSTSEKLCRGTPGFLAGKCYLSYRRRGGHRTVPLPDFYIGAHAAIERLALLTRDVVRYRTYFPKVEILGPA